MQLQILYGGFLRDLAQQHAGSPNKFSRRLAVGRHEVVLGAAQQQARRERGAARRGDEPARERLASADRRTGYVDALADFELLLFLCAFPEIFDPHTFMPAICDAVANISSGEKAG